MPTFHPDVMLTFVAEWIGDNALLEISSLSSAHHRIIGSDADRKCPNLRDDHWGLQVDSIREDRQMCPKTSCFADHLSG